MAVRKKRSTKKAGGSVVNEMRALIKPGFARRLTALRERARLTQADLADRVELNFATVSRFESGTNLPDKASTLILLGVALDCSVDYLLFGDEREPRLTKKAMDVAERLPKLSRDQLDAVAVMVESMTKRR